MAYFRIIVGLRGCYSDSSENAIYECADAAALHDVIADRLAWHAETGEEAPAVDPCTLEEAAAIFHKYTGPKAPYLPTCAASFQDGQMGVLVSGASESEYAETELAYSDSCVATSGNVYIKAPACLAYFLEYGDEGDGTGADAECEAYRLQAMAFSGCPETQSHKLINVSTEGQYDCEQLPAFTLPSGHAYTGAACVLCYVPGLPDMESGQ